MKVSLIGMGPGGRELLTQQALDALQKAKAVIGARRLLEALPEEAGGQNIPLLHPGEIAAWLARHRDYDPAAVVLSGDIGFYSGAARLRPLLLQAGFEVESICGISSVACLCAKAGIPWQNVHLVSAHGRSCDVLAHVLNHQTCFFLTGGEVTPGSICQILMQAGLGNCPVTVGENLSYPQERLLSAPARELAGQEFASLSVVLVERTKPAFCRQSRTYGIPDDEFIRGEVPMTKQEVRSVILSRLAVQEADTLWDIGAGTGSVAIECAFAARWGRVWAIEQAPKAWDLLGQNKEKFGVYNLNLVKGMAPDVCRDLPAPDAAFIGGSKGRLEEMLQLLLEKNPKVRVVISAVTLETMYKGLTLLEALGFEQVEAVQFWVSRTQTCGAGHLLRGQNPVFVISGAGHG